MDAQVFWDPIGSCSCWHGVTTVVMGNCGFTLAPGKEAQRDMVLSNIIRAEDISADAMAAAIDWKWTTFRDYMNVVDALPKSINYAANIGHSALRTYVMNERAFDAKATVTNDDLAAMEHELMDALDAGAIGFTTSRSNAHKLPEPDNRPVASYNASWAEMEQLVCAMGKTGRGIFELARERDARSPDPAVRKAVNDKLTDLAVKSGAPTTFGMPGGSLGAQDAITMLDTTAARGGRMFGQTHTRGVSHVLSFRGRLQFDDLAEWKEVRNLPFEDQRVAFSDPERKKRLIEATKTGIYRTGGGEPRKPNFDNMYVVQSAVSKNPTVAQLAAQRSRWTKLHEWAIRHEHADVATLPDGKGGQQEFDREQVSALKAQTFSLLNEAAPKREQFLQTRAQVDAYATQAYPWLANAKAGDGATVAKLLSDLPVLRTLPGGKLLASDAFIGGVFRAHGITVSKELIERLAKEAKASAPRAGQPRASTPLRAPAAPSRPSTVPARLDRRQTQSRAAEQRITREKGSEDSLAESIAALL